MSQRDLEKEAKDALDKIEMLALLCADKYEENIFIMGFIEGYKNRMEQMMEFADYCVGRYFTTNRKGEWRKSAMGIDKITTKDIFNEFEKLKPENE